MVVQVERAAIDVARLGSHAGNQAEFRTFARLAIPKVILLTLVILFLAGLGTCLWDLGQRERRAFAAVIIGVQLERVAAKVGLDVVARNSGQRNTTNRLANVHADVFRLRGADWCVDRGRLRRCCGGTRLGDGCYGSSAGLAIALAARSAFTSETARLDLLAELAVLEALDGILDPGLLEANSELDFTGHCRVQAANTV